MKAVLLVVSIVVTFQAACIANTVPVNLIKFSKSIRGTALGDALAAYPLNTDAILYNPAALCKGDKGINYTNETLDMHGTIYSINHTEAFTYGYLGYSKERKYVQNDRLTVNSYGIGVPGSNAVYWGLTYKDVTYTTGEESSRGMSIDFGLLTPLSKNMLFGFLAKDIYKSNIAVPASISVGTTFFSIFKSTAMLLEAEYIRASNEIFFKSGFEMNIDSTLVLRFGYGDERLRAGGSFLLPFGRIDYSISTGANQDTRTIHQIGFYLSR